MIARKSNSPDLAIKKLNHRGVSSIPINPEILALKIAVGRFPRAIATITTEDETVEGNTPKKKTESHNSEFVPPSKKGINKKVSNGKIKKVEI